MKSKKFFLITLMFIFLCVSNLFARAFEEYVLTPKLGIVSLIPTRAIDDPKDTEHWPLGLSIDFDAKFNHKSGFTLMTTANIWVIIDLNVKPPAIPVMPILLPNIMLGYTYGINQNFQFTIASGLGFSIPFFVPTIPLQFDFSYFFNNKYGITVTLKNDFAIIPNPVALMDFAELSIGAGFRL